MRLCGKLESLRALRRGLFDGNGKPFEPSSRSHVRNRQLPLAYTKSRTHRFHLVSPSCPNLR